MKYRKLTATGDSTFGSGVTQFYENVPDAPAQAVGTRLKLIQGEWFLDQNEGTPYSKEILGTGTMTLYNLAIRERILNTQGVKSILEYSSNINAVTRALTVAATIDTVYGTPAPVEVAL